MKLPHPLTGQLFDSPVPPGAGWPEDPESDVAAGAWAGVVPLTVGYGTPQRAPDCDPATPLPASVQAMTGPLRNAAPPLR